MIAAEIGQFIHLNEASALSKDANIQQSGDQGMPRRKESLVGPTREAVGDVVREDHDEPVPMDIDEELRMKGH